ncbi:DUF2085 domain-containing protein [Solidesulfovibrio sp.]
MPVVLMIENENQVVRKVSVVASIVSGIYIVIAVLPTILYLRKSPLTSLARAVSGAICHQKPSRCLWVFDYPCGLCVKCMGFYLGILVGSLFSLLFKKILNLSLSIFFCLFLAVALLDSYVGFIDRLSVESLYGSFVFGFAGGVGVFSVALNNIYSGGRFMSFVARNFCFMVIFFVLVNLYGFSIALGQSVVPVGEQGSSIVIPGGTGVVLQLVGSVTTKESREGDAVPLYVVSPIRVKDYIVIRGGTPARGMISMAHAASSWGGAGELCVEAKSVQAIDGTEILISGITSRRGETSHGTSAAVAVGTGVLCLPLALTGAAVKGEEGRVMPGFEFVARTLNDQTIRIPSETEQQNIQKQQEEVLKSLRANAEIKAQKMKEEEEKKKKNKTQNVEH